MIRLNLLFPNLLLVLIFFPVKAQFNRVEGIADDPSSNFQPSLAIVIGILCIMFSVTFILLVYVKFCHRGVSFPSLTQNNPMLVRSGSRYSGVDKTVIESLPFFRFSSLKGSKGGLECAVCLSKFEDVEVLRLLPKCKHAFHINCVDQWLEKHSSCPLCRCKISAEDPTLFTYSASMRFLGRDDSNMELFVQREESNRQASSSFSSSRFCIGSSFRKIDKKDDNDEEAILIQESEIKDLHKFNHKIIVSDFVLKNRWSSVSSSDLMFLNSEMLQDFSSNRFSSLDLNNEQFSNARTMEDDNNNQIMKIKEEMEIKRLFESKVSSINKYNHYSDPCSSSDSKEKTGSSIMNNSSTGRRSVSEITAFSRFRNFNFKNSLRESGGNNKNEERQRRVWLPIARRTVQWFVNRERTSQLTHHQNKTQTLDV
ncbi:hypothetical protein JCGZ_07290 [Jatropha curcas]|uniref:RING-type E3 ubiquitin transferase n=1 Tax=Jatropha curcas TaxID=180498 RepID=A0A067KPL4_JATCU|nr:E3 ubiquitin-protein ligase ATL42 [Jatropha curcas]KDP33719.1 hypothetical protein JCGZ_07290 [Jatropha curcas]